MRTPLTLVLLLAATPAAAWWDLGPRTVAELAWRDLSHHSRREIRRLLRAEAGLDTPQCRARESWQVSRDFAYPDLGLGDVCAIAWPPALPVAIDYGYDATAAPIVRERIARAGARLAALLDGALGGRPQ